MFDRDFTFTGKHATYVKFLVHNAKLYKRYMDVYMSGAVFGLLHNRKAPRDTSSTDDATIPAGTLIGSRDNCMLLYRLAMLLGDATTLDQQARIDRAFRDDANEEEPEKLQENLELFNSFVRGGIEEMYEEFIDGHGTTSEEYLERALDVMEGFRDDMNGEGYKEKISAII